MHTVPLSMLLFLELVILLVRCVPDSKHEGMRRLPQSCALSRVCMAERTLVAIVTTWVRVTGVQT